MKETILDRIVADIKAGLPKRKANEPISALEERAATLTPPKSFAEALRGESISLIAEVKARSPSRGVLKAELDPVGQAETYARNGASAISVLTEKNHFNGSLEHLLGVRQCLGEARPALLRKDFIFDPYQLYQARAYGADTALLIVAILEPSQMKELMGVARELGLSTLIEVHNEAELKQALEAEAEIIGINNRDLRTFETDLATTERLARLIPADKTIVSESGIRSRADVERVRSAGANAILVGEALITAGDVGEKIRELIGQ
jgi:indole-3-glycerol phosphate synthase